MPISIQAVIDGVIHYGALALIHGTVLALITWLLSATLLRRSRPAFQAALWTIVLIKFLLPPVLPGEMALSGWIAEAATSVTVTQRGNTESSSEPINREFASNHGPGAPVGSGGNQAARLLFICYLFFVIVLSGRALMTLRRTGRRIRALASADSSTKDEVRALAEWIGLNRAPDVRTTNDETTPYVFGFRRAVLVLPERVMRVLEASERRALILHELAHLRRGDPLIRVLQSLAGVFFFFFPPVLWVCRRVEHFTEMACDHWAITISDAEPQAYAEALVKIVKGIRLSPQTQVGLPLVRGVKLLEERLRAVLRNDRRTPPRLSMSAKLVLASWSLFVLMGGSTAVVRRPVPLLSQTDMGRVEEISSRSAVLTENEPKVTSRQGYFDKTSQDQRVSSKEVAAPQVQDRRADQDRSGRETPRSDDTQTAAEKRAVEQSWQSVTAPIASDNTMSPYERGYLLARRYAQESAGRSPGSTTVQQVTPTEESSGRETKRNIEIRMRELSKHPSPQ